jgi:hypothetical protein
MVEFHTLNMLYLYHRSRAYSRHISLQPGILSASSSEPVPLKLRRKKKGGRYSAGSEKLFGWVTNLKYLGSHAYLGRGHNSQGSAAHDVAPRIRRPRRDLAFTRSDQSEFLLLENGAVLRSMPRCFRPSRVTRSNFSYRLLVVLPPPGQP